MAEKSKWTMDVENKQDFHCTDSGFNHAGNNKVINMLKTKQKTKPSSSKRRSAVVLQQQSFSQRWIINGTMTSQYFWHHLIHLTVTARGSLSIKQQLDVKDDIEKT